MQRKSLLYRGTTFVLQNEGVKKIHSWRGSSSDLCAPCAVL